MISPFIRRALWLLAVPVLLLAAAVFATASVEREAAERSSAAVGSAQRMLTAMLDQETGARGFFQTRDRQFLAPWYDGTADFASAASRTASLAGSESGVRSQLRQQRRIASEWHALTGAEIERTLHGGRAPSVAAALGSKALMDDFRTAHAAFIEGLARDGKRGLIQASWLDAAVAAAFAAAMALIALTLLRRTARGERRRLREQSELRELLQASDTEQESRALLIHHIERALPGAEAAVLNRNNSDDRLEPLLAAQRDGGLLAGLSNTALRPRSCLAVRLSRPFDRVGSEETLLRCETCGKIAADTACEPLVVGGQVIGSVLVARKRPIAPRERTEVRDAVVQAAPIVANQRNLALAEQRAASDALTGLPNRRAAEDTLKRMAAQAGRSSSPLVAILLDLDHFKRINDLYGHDRGDEALAVAGETLTATLRRSDFAARYGGEEFLVLLPETDRSGGLMLAEKLRAAIEGAPLSGGAALSASLGVAVYPDDAADTDELLRRADRALYLAKKQGRNRVESAAEIRGPGEADEEAAAMPVPLAGARSEA